MRQADRAGDMFLRKGGFGSAIHDHHSLSIADRNMKIPGIHFKSELTLIMGHLFD
jgi:hypothetical protein